MLDQKVCDLQQEVIGYMNQMYHYCDNSDELAEAAAEKFNVEDWLDSYEHPIYKWADDFFPD